MTIFIASFWASCTTALSGVTVCDVRDYGATGDERGKGTQALQKAIEACAQKAGVVHVPPATYLTGAITLRVFV